MAAALDRRQPPGGLALRSLSRYIFKTPTANRTVDCAPDGQVQWPCRSRQTGQLTTLPLGPLEFLARFLQHILPRSFARGRTFGWLHPTARVRGNRVRAVLELVPELGKVCRCW